MVRYHGTDYSVPTAYGHRGVLVRGYVDRVEISCGAETIARHVRWYEREDFVFDPLHYLALLEHKTGALDQAAPLAGWDLPEVFATLRRLLEARMGKQGKREFVQVLRLMEVFAIEDVAAGVRESVWPIEPCRPDGQRVVRVHLGHRAVDVDDPLVSRAGSSGTAQYSTRSYPTATTTSARSKPKFA